LRIAQGDLAQARCNGGDGLVPADAFELALALLAHAAHGVQQAVLVIGALGIA
jgi:hypothetical protein